MAQALIGGHINRAVDFYNAVNKYFIIGGTKEWENNTPAPITGNEFKLVDIVGLKKVDNCYLVVPAGDDETENIIEYRDTRWKKVQPTTWIPSFGRKTYAGEYQITVPSTGSFQVGMRIRIKDIYEGTIVETGFSQEYGNYILLDTPAPQTIDEGTKIFFGALPEGAHHVYVDCNLNYNDFPLATYRQIGLCTGVEPNGNLAYDDILRAKEYGGYNESNEWHDIGILEVLDNRDPSVRNISQKEHISLIIEF